jgi:SAM-dependent methyltransferase
MRSRIAVPLLNQASNRAPTAHDDAGLLPSGGELAALFGRCFGHLEHGWRTRMRQRFGYFSPDQWYEAIVDRLVAPGCRWLDVGGGKTIFPENEPLSRELAARCGLLVGVDPSDNVLENAFVHRRVRSTIEEFGESDSFDLATLRMVAEHVEQPGAVVAALSRLVAPGGYVVIFTPNRWSPVAMLGAAIPDRWHARLTRVSDDRSDEDVFPTRYRMNTRRQLEALFATGGFREAAFAYLDNCRTLQRFRPTCFLELSAWRVLRAIGLRYPENDLLGVYERLKA